MQAVIAAEAEAVGSIRVTDDYVTAVERLKGCQGKVITTGIGKAGHIARKFLMCTGGDDYVRGDVHVRRFVAEAIGQASVSATQARSLVRRSAHELILSPRFLYLEIRRHCLTRRESEGDEHPAGDSSPEADESRSPREHGGGSGS